MSFTPLKDLYNPSLKGCLEVIFVVGRVSSMDLIRNAAAVAKPGNGEVEVRILRCSWAGVVSRE